MKINANSVILANRGFLQQYVPDISARDTDATVINKAQHNITVTPNNTEATSVTVRFITNLIVAVSDGEPDAEAIRRMLGSIAGAAAGASTGAGVGALVVNGIDVAGDISNAAREIYRTSQRTSSIQFIAPIEVTRDGCTYEASARLVGSTLTTDTDAADEKANIESDMRLQSVRSRPKTKQENEGQDVPLSFDLLSTIQNVQLNRGIVDSAATAQMVLMTDGAFWHDTISAVKLDFIELVYLQRCPGGGQPPRVQPPRTETPSGTRTEPEREAPEAERQAQTTPRRRRTRRIS